ncbi:MAG: antitoxin [Capnocytophaga sp.]|nr:MAG: antitoxin [Capnocytophaga sp.]
MCLLVYPKTQSQINILTSLFKEMNIDFEYDRQPKEEESYIPNKLTLQAMKEAEAMAKDKNKKKYATVDELMESLKD